MFMMPEMISVNEFIEETRDDFHSPTTSTFVSRIPHCRNSVMGIEEALDTDRESLIKTKKSIKAIHQSGSTYVESELQLSRALERLGNGALSSQEPELGAAFLKFAVVTKELSNLQKTLMQNLQNMILFPLDSLLKGDIRLVKGELKRPFEKAVKDYEAKHAKLEKEKKAQARDAGMFRKEVTPAEIADETEKERRLLQLQMCEYLAKVNEIKTKKGAELLKHFVDYYYALNNYFQDGLKTMEHFGSYITILSNNLSKLRAKQTEEKRKLTEMGNLLRTTSVLEKELSNASQGGGSTGAGQPGAYSLHQMQGNKSLGVTKIGYLNKKSEGKMRRVWQKRKCAVQDGVLEIFHGDEGKLPTRVNLLTCQLKVVSEDKKFFDLVSYNRTYHLHSDDESEEWISVILNSKEASMAKTLDQKVDNDGLLELTQAILGHIHRLPGNDRCADCNSEKEVTWLSVNLGVIVCIECSGVHRTLGVSVSRIQSISLDRIPPSLLILSSSLGNFAMNEILEENLRHGHKPCPTATMEEREEFIRAKYVEKKYVGVCGDQESLTRRVELAMDSDDLLLLVRTWAQGANLSEPLPQNDEHETPLHAAIYRADLRIVDFLIHNSGATEKKTFSGLTPLHVCAWYGKSEPAKLLLRAGADLQIMDNDKRTPLDLARQRKSNVVEDLLLHAMEGKRTLFETVDFDWNLGAEDSTDFSDDEPTALEDPSVTPEKRRRPSSFLVESPYRSTNDLRNSGMNTPGSGISSVTSAMSNKNLRHKRTAPPPPSPSNHTRSPSDSLIGKLGLGRLVIPPGEPPALRKTTSIPPSSPLVTTANQSPLPSSFNNTSTPLTSNAFSIMSSVVLGGSSPSTMPSPVVPINTTRIAVPSANASMLPNGNSNNSQIPLDIENYRKCRALYDCEADNSDEISFRQGDVILILNERTEDENWMEGLVLDERGNGSQRGMFPVSFVETLDPER